ncbi:hypothetical protein G9A89_008064 [Geosiphon pyriformis]|nr:hypothetical protein G9A89_008064 [Geosiphon pyriformis]
MGVCCSDDEKYQMATKFYCHVCIIKHFGRPKQQRKWDNKSCLVCGKTLFDEGICPHDDNELWRMAIAKIEEALPEKIREIKNNPPEPIELDWNPEPVINLLDSEQFYEYYQELVFTREEQEQYLKQLNTQLC